jgi:hypothetical protein
MGKVPALEAAMRCRFDPSTRAGAPVRVQVAIPHPMR